MCCCTDLLFVLVFDSMPCRQQHKYMVRTQPTRGSTATCNKYILAAHMYAARDGLQYIVRKAVKLLHCIHDARQLGCTLYTEVQESFLLSATPLSRRVCFAQKVGLTTVLISTTLSNQSLTQESTCWSQVDGELNCSNTGKFAPCTKLYSIPFGGLLKG